LWLLSVFGGSGFLAPRHAMNRAICRAASEIVNRKPGRPAARHDARPLNRDLLPQPGGFESLGVALVSATPHGETIAVAGEPADFRIQRDAAPEPGAKVAQCEDGVAEVSNLLNTRLKLLEGGVHIRPPLPEALVTVVGLVALNLRRERVPLGLGVRDLQHRLDVAPVVTLEGLMEKLHVLLRHRPRSIALWRERAARRERSKRHVPAR
jgi:hypothetical protein